MILGSQALCLCFRFDPGPKHTEISHGCTLEAGFLACYSVPAISLRAAKSLRVRKYQFDSMTRKQYIIPLKGFLYPVASPLPKCHQSSAINCVFRCCHFLSEKGKLFFLKVKCNLVFQVYVTDKFILIC